MACMAIYWPIPGFKGRTFKLCVLTRWDFNFCVRCSPLRGMPAKIVDRSYSPHKIHSSCQCWRTTYGENYTLNVFSCSCFSLSQFEQWPLYFERPFIVIFWLCTQEAFTVRHTWAETLFFFFKIQYCTFSFLLYRPPKGGLGCLMSPPCLESQGCHLIPLCYLLSCSSA